MRRKLLGGAVLTAAVAALTMASVPAYAEKLLGVETEPAEEVDPEDEVDAESEKPRAKAPAPKATKRSSGANANAPEGGDFTFFGSLGASTKGVFGGMAGVGYSVNRYVGIDGSYSYYQVQVDSKEGVQYGPSVDLVLRLPNPTIVTPYVGVGVGHLKWQRSYRGEAFDAGSAATGSAFGGANLNLTRHFGLQLERRQITYVNDPPKRFDDMVTREPRSRVATNIGFYMKF